MSEKKTLTPIAAALGTTFAISLLASPLANASDNPFELTELKSGFMVAEADTEGSCGEGSCGESSDDAGGEEGSCGEGSCGESSDDAGGEEGSCGEGSCGESGDT